MFYFFVFSFYALGMYFLNNHDLVMALAFYLIAFRECSEHFGK